MTVRNTLAGEWTAVAFACLLLSLHAWWLRLSDHQGDVVSGLGGSLAALGVYVATQPYIRKGLIETAREQVGLHDPAERYEEAERRKDEAQTAGVRHVVKERVVGVMLIALGSLLNGYGPAVAHLFSLRGA